jgi:DNA-binding MarR family transcriptional regulator
MISVVRDSCDRRRLVVKLSDKGLEEVARLKFVAREIEMTLLDELGPEDRANLKTAIGGLYERL